MIIEMIGFIGMSLILFAFIKNQFHNWKDDFLIYDLFNFLGSSLLIFYSFLIKSYPFLILNGVWGFVSLRDIFLDLRKKKK